MIVGAQIQITEAMITASNITRPGNPGDWSAGTSYTVGAEAYYNGSEFRSLTDSNLGNTPPDVNIDANWVYIGATNKLKPFEQEIHRVRVYDQAQNADEITYTIEPGVWYNMLGFFGLDAYAIQIVMTDPTAGEVYNQTIALADISNLTSYYSWFVRDYRFKKELVRFDLPPYPDAETEITISKAAGTAAVGQIVFARQVPLGITVTDTEISSKDFSTMEQDINGEFTDYTDRGRVSVVKFRAVVDTDQARYIQNTIDDYLSGKPAIYAMGQDTEQFATTIFGWSSGVSIPLAVNKSYMTMKVEGFK